MIDDFQSISDDDICRSIVSLDDNAIAISGIAENGTFVGYYENKQLITRAQDMQQKEHRSRASYLQDIPSTAYTYYYCQVAIILCISTST